MFNTIINPETGRMVNLNSKVGKKVIKNYKQFGGFFSRKKIKSKNKKNQKPRLEEYVKTENNNFLGLRNPFQPSIEVSKSMIKRFKKNNAGSGNIRPKMVVTKNNKILTHNYNDNIYIVDPKNGEITTDLKIRDKEKQGKGFTFISGVALNSKNDLLAACDYEGFIKIFNIRTDECIELRKRTFKRCENVDPKSGEVWNDLDESDGVERNNILFSYNNKLLITSSPQSGSGIDVWDFEKRLLKFNIDSQITLGNKIIISPNNKFLTGTYDGGILGNNSKIKIWNLDTGVLHKEFNFGRGSITDIIYNKKGDKLILVEGKKIQIWNIKDGELETEMYSDGHDSKILSIDISSNGKNIITAGMDKTIIVWNIELEQEMFTLTGHEGPVYDVKFTNNNDIFSLSHDNTLAVWKLPVRI
tara:strand:- start:748 stop:1992 length:1245 start_codon:yes stop_codon:yes gene_type:complete